MKLRIVTPLSIEVDEDGVESLRAEDASGGFGILPRHADFLTSLSISVVSWTRADGAQRYCAVRRGVLTMSGGREVRIATREAVVGDDLARLDTAVLARFRADLDLERTQRVEGTRLQINAIRLIMRYLRAGQYRGSGIG
ncbi:F0F1 ATP synthase subunit epsilon [Metallibacterium scheffleri]|uniref:ATP synthase epsilon chain n=2 Tax=root TaxID=1 RepID=A0A4S3KIK4_9GAMM|nr:F0F1 ATP synthase subunit epsilon [Metallibacterium scheffleri]THD08138.1 F0F1 ATP synthase subunit epsilon [Metallibacterium scheffleri]